MVSHRLKCKEPYGRFFKRLIKERMGSSLSCLVWLLLLNFLLLTVLIFNIAQNYDWSDPEKAQKLYLKGMAALSFCSIHAHIMFYLKKMQCVLEPLHEELGIEETTKEDEESLTLENITLSYVCIIALMILNLYLVNDDERFEVEAWGKPVTLYSALTAVYLAYSYADMWECFGILEMPDHIPS